MMTLSATYEEYMMDYSKERVLAYELATVVDPSEQEEIAGGFSMQIPTVQVTTVDIFTLDTNLDHP